MKVKCKVTNPFNDVQDDKQRRVGEEFECTLERAEFLQKNNVVDIIEATEKSVEETLEKPKRKRTKKTIENEK